jgi:hypothetical protein
MRSFCAFVFIACIIICAWGFVSVQAEVANRNPRDSFNSLANRFKVDSYVWSNEASPALRRRYILCMACMPVAGLCYAYIGLNSPPHPQGDLTAGIIGISVAVWTGANLLVKILRHGF